MISNIKMVAADVAVKWAAFGQCRVIRLFGYNNQAADRYIQLHAEPAASVAASDIPAVASFWCAASTAFSWSLDPNHIELAELAIAISTTEVNYTAASAGTGLDLTAVVDSDFLVVSGTTTVVGDLTTGVADKQIWAESVGAANSLLRLDVKNNSGANAYILIYPEDTPIATENPLAIPKLVADTATVSQFFGRGGLFPYRKTAAKVERKGLTIKMAPGATLPFTFATGTDYNIRAIHD